MTVRNASLLVAALEHAWAMIRARHPQVPEAVLVVASGGAGRRLKWGHFAAGRWQQAGGRQPEVLVGGEGLARARGIQDTSRGGRYHNRRYAALAGELGLEVARVAGIGWSATTLPEATAAAYAEVLAEVEARLVLWRRQEVAGPAGSRNLLVCVCGCPRRIRVAPSTLAAAPILCGACDLPFTPDVDD